MAQWHAQINQQPYGPVDEPTLQSWVTQGRLGPYDLIWSEGMPNWAQACTVFPGWFGQTPPPLTNVMPPPGMPGMSTSGLKSHRGGLILTFGILGLTGVVFCLTLIFAVLAWVMGQTDLREMREGRMNPAGRGLTAAGRVCGIIGTVSAALGIVARIVSFMYLIDWLPRQK